MSFTVLIKGKTIATLELLSPELSHYLLQLFNFFLPSALHRGTAATNSTAQKSSNPCECPGIS